MQPVAGVVGDEQIAQSERPKAPHRHVDAGGPRVVGHPLAGPADRQQLGDLERAARMLAEREQDRAQRPAPPQLELDAVDPHPRQLAGAAHEPDRVWRSRGDRRGGAQEARGARAEAGLVDAGRQQLDVRRQRLDLRAVAFQPRDLQRFHRGFELARVVASRDEPRERFADAQRCGAEIAEQAVHGGLHPRDAPRVEVVARRRKRRLCT